MKDFTRFEAGIVWIIYSIIRSPIQAAAQRTFDIGRGVMQYMCQNREILLLSQTTGSMKSNNTYIILHLEKKVKSILY